MFENVRNIKTKNLYLCKLGLVQNVECDTEFFCQEYQEFILAKKVVRNCENYYQDIFTKTLYENSSYPIYKSGKVYVLSAVPILSNLSYISKNEANVILEERTSLYLKPSNNVDKVKKLIKK